MLSVLSLATVVARAFYGGMAARLGRRMTMLASSLSGAAMLVLLWLPLPPTAIFAALAILGFCIGAAGSATLSLAIAAAPVGARATTISLRQMGTRLGQMIIPLGLGALGATLGFSSIFMSMGVALASIGTAAFCGSRPR
ncbi:MFS transporter [Consotaella aegiceratis]|uniref:MFS transporter n=1 Tax=Consotaella aegiceratis TaxID=3097961 RepID=UPI002F42F0E3